jgi:hypothetical protein
MNDWILMVKGDEQKLVHPGNVDNHKRAGWTVADAPATQDARQEADQAIDTLVAEAVQAFEAFEAPADAASLDVLRAAPAPKKRKAKGA